MSITGSSRLQMTGGSIAEGSQYSSASLQSLLPNLPGYRQKHNPDPFRKSSFTCVDGSVFMKDSAVDEIVSLAEGSIEEGSVMSIGAVKRRPRNTDHGVILTFKAYFEEFPEGLRDGERYIRECSILYYLQDDEIKIVEKPQLNSGLTQGVLARKQRILREDGTPFSIFDFRISEPVYIFKREYMIVDYDNATRQYLLDMGYDDDPPIKVPNDSYQEYRLLLQKDMDLTSNPDKFKCTKNDNKTFADAVMGVLIDNSGREGFMKHDRNSLDFKCVWDNTGQLYGDRLEFLLKYYLADDTIEINSCDSRDRVKLLKRSKLPKRFAETMVLGERPKRDEFFLWTDLYIGKYLEVYGRRLQLVDANSFTREYYAENGNQLGSPIVFHVAEVVRPVREIPPPTGFGSEEDSMRSVSGSLMPGKPPMKKPGENKIVSFFASLLSGGIDDIDRRFVLSYYVIDNTLKIHEPPVRNSGFTGGVFLSRRPIKKEDGEELKFHDLYIGCKVQVLKHRFLLLDAAGSTLKWMEQCLNGRPLPRSDYYAILEKMRPAFLKHAEDGTLLELFKSYEAPENGVEQGYATTDTLRTIATKYHLMSDHPDDISEHELRTILRGAGNEGTSFYYPDFVSEIIEPTDRFK